MIGPMKRIFVPTQGPSDWKRLLAQPELHWKGGYSAMTTAACWDAAGHALPAEIRQMLNDTRLAPLQDLELLAAIPEWQTRLPGGDRASCTDVMAIARNDAGLVVIGVEAKVDEEFGPLVGEKRLGASKGQLERLEYLERVLKVPSGFEDSVRYQLLHRTASALITAQQFHADTAVMLVHSFSPMARWREDFDSFATALGATPVSANVYQLANFSSPSLFLAWCAGDPRFLKDL